VTLYGMSSLQSVNMAVGGCGQKRDRPLGDDRQPVADWDLTCAPCEQFVAGDPGWSARASERPRTYDEIKQAE
jgi:hypothetical protein